MNDLAGGWLGCLKDDRIPPKFLRAEQLFDHLTLMWRVKNQKVQLGEKEGFVAAKMRAKSSSQIAFPQSGHGMSPAMPSSKRACHGEVPS